MASRRPPRGCRDPLSRQDSELSPPKTTSQKLAPPLEPRTPSRTAFHQDKAAGRKAVQAKGHFHVSRGMRGFVKPGRRTGLVGLGAGRLSRELCPHAGPVPRVPQAPRLGRSRGWRFSPARAALGPLGPSRFFSYPPFLFLHPLTSWATVS